MLTIQQDSHTINWTKYILICLFFLSITWITQTMLINDTLFFNYLSNTHNFEEIEQLIKQEKKWSWIGYLLIPFIYLLKISLIASLLSLGSFFTSNRFNFKTFFNIVVFSELIFLLPILIKLLWFVFIQTDYDINDLTLFYPLSALNLVDATDLPRYWLYPLQTLNLFEVGYWFLLAYGVTDATGFSIKRSFGLVMSFYGIGLVLWVVLVMFITITYS